MNAKFAAVALLVAAACHSDQTSSNVGETEAQIEHETPLRAWNVVDGGKILGNVILFADPTAPGDPAKQFFSVRNPFHQELGTLDGFGRAWRFLPHQREAKLIGTGTVLDGARKILDGTPSCELFEVSIESLKAKPASAKKSG